MEIMNKKIRIWVSLGILALLGGVANYLYWPLIDQALIDFPPDSMEAELQGQSKSPEARLPSSRLILAWKRTRCLPESNRLTTRKYSKAA